MKDIKDQLIEIRNYCVRYGNIVSDEEWEGNRGEQFRETVFEIDSSLLYIVMKNGDVLSIRQ